MRWVLVLLAGFALGCSTTKVVTISTQPPDAMIRINGVDRARGSVVEQFVFVNKNDSHTVTVSRLGYREQSINVTRDFERDTLNVELRPLSRRVTISTAPLPALVTVNGRPITPDPVESTTVELEFTVDARNNWTTHVIAAEHPLYQRVEQVVSWQDKEPLYLLHLQPKRKDLAITTAPRNATIFLDNEQVATSPAIVPSVAFPPDPESNEIAPRRLRAVVAGYDPVEIAVGWDDGQSDYHIDLKPKSKMVRIITDPPAAVVTIDDQELPRNESGISTASLVFPPVNEKGELRTHTATVSKRTADSEWEPGKLVIGWDEGRSDYRVVLKEIKTTPVVMLTPTLRRSEDGWEVIPEVVTTLAMKDVSEGTHKEPPLQLSQLPRATQIDSLTVSPDGSKLLFTTLTGTTRDNFRSQIVIIRADGAGGASYLSDGKSLEITPSFTPDGEFVVFSSNRAGRRLSIWRMSAVGAPGITQLTSGDTNDLWPNIDSDPKPRLFYQASVDTRSDPRIYMTHLGTTTRTDLTQISGMQPRVSPRNDSVVFTAINQKTGKRDIYLMSDRGGQPQNLTNTPDVDEFAPAWNSDGTKIAFVSDAGVDEDRRRNYDIWVMEVARPERPAQITTNGSWDDHPVWDPTGNYIYFRSNRGGEWNIWRINAR